MFFLFLLWPRPDAHSLTVGWGDFGKARVVFVFFWLRPRRTRRANNKKCLVYYIGSKKTRRGHSKKNTPLPSRTLSSKLKMLFESCSLGFGAWHLESRDQDSS